MPITQLKYFNNRSAVRDQVKDLGSDGYHYNIKQKGWYYVDI